MTISFKTIILKASQFHSVRSQHLPTTTTWQFITWKLVPLSPEILLFQTSSFLSSRTHLLWDGQIRSMHVCTLSGLQDTPQKLLMFYKCHLEVWLSHTTVQRCRQQAGRLAYCCTTKAMSSGLEHCSLSWTWWQIKLPMHYEFDVRFCFMQELTFKHG